MYLLTADRYDHHKPSTCSLRFSSGDEIGKNRQSTIAVNSNSTICKLCITSINDHSIKSETAQNATLVNN